MIFIDRDFTFSGSKSDLRHSHGVLIAMLVNELHPSASIDCQFARFQPAK
jgi:hypothetical protein